MPMQTWTARFVVDHGRVTEEGGLLRSFPRRRLDEPEVDLHILADPRGSKGDDLGAQAIDNIGKLFLEDKLSLTGGLLRAVRSTHQTLLEWNRRSIPGDQVTTGISAAVIHGVVVYLLQAGPSLAYLLRQGRLELLDVEEDAMLPLGEGSLEPAMRYVSLQPGDLLLAASCSLSSVIDEQALEELLRRGTEEALPELFLLTRDLPSFALFAITCLEQDEAPGEVLETNDLDLEPLVEAPLEAEPPPPKTQDLSRRQEPPRTRQPPSRTGPVPPPGVQLVQPPPIDISRRVVRLRGGQPSSRSDYARTTGGARRPAFDFSQTRLLVMIGAAALVLFVGAFTVPDLIRENRGEKVALLLQSAQTQISAAAAEGDPAMRRQLLDEARSLAAEAVRIEPENTIAAELRQQAVLELERLNAVFDIGPMTTVAALSQLITGEISIEGMEVAGGSGYLIDSKGGRVLAVALDGSGGTATIFQEGDIYGDTPADKPVFITWEGSQEDGRLLVLDAERKLFALRPGSLPESLPLRRTNTWTSVAGIASYDGNLYVLDPVGNQVHRYLPAASGFDSEPTNALSGDADLSDAVDIAVNGEIFVLKRNGVVDRFLRGENAGFSLGGIDRPMTGPTSIKVAANAAEVYIADAGNKRVVIASKDGLFQRQFVTSDFTDLSSIAIDELSGQIYVMVDDTLLSAPIVR